MANLNDLILENFQLKAVPTYVIINIPQLKFRAATKLFGTSRRIGWENDIQTMITMNPNPKAIELRANKIQWN